jgi:hypothetical protein
MKERTEEELANAACGVRRDKALKAVTFNLSGKMSDQSVAKMAE